MKTSFIAPFALVAFLLIISGCKKEDTIPPVVAIEIPTSGSSYSVGDTVDVHVNVTEETEMHESIVYTTENGATTILHSQTYHSHDISQHLDYELPVDSAYSGKTLIIRAEAEDNSGNIGSDEIQVIIN